MASYSIILCSTYILFLLFGGFIFMYLEWEVIETMPVGAPDSWIRLKEVAQEVSRPTNEDELTSLVGWVLGKCPELHPNTSRVLTSIGNQSSFVEEMENLCPWLKPQDATIQHHYPWSFIDSLYFSMTVSTTIGYGHISPTTSIGMIVCILYSLVGIPLTGILLAWTSGIFGEHLFHLFTSMFSEERQLSKVFIGVVSIFYILAGFVVFIFVPAIIFVTIEEWTYLEGVYYAYITLTTIGFGDFVTGKSIEGPWAYIYQIGVILWILVGLGYWVMVASFIQRALKSKKINDLAKKAASLKKLMQNHVSGRNHEPQFVSQTSKATLNFLLQLSNTLVAPELTIPREGSPGTPSSPQIPGIAALFQQASSRGNFNHFLSAGVMGINVKTDANGNTKDEDGKQVQPNNPTEQEAAVTEPEGSPMSIRIDPVSQEADDASSNCGRSSSLGEQEPTSHLSENLRRSTPILIEDRTTVEEEEGGEAEPFLELLKIYQDPQRRNSLIRNLSCDLEKLQTSIQGPSYAQAPLQGCQTEVVR